MIEPTGDAPQPGHRWFSFLAPWASDVGHEVLKIVEGDYMAYKPHGGHPQVYRAEKASFEGPKQLFELLEVLENELEEELLRLEQELDSPWSPLGPVPGE